jgi:hypothetical protein
LRPSLDCCYLVRICRNPINTDNMPHVVDGLFSKVALGQFN